MSESEKKDKVPAWLQIISAVVAILIAFFTVYKWWYEKNTDANCEILLTKARESISEGRKNTTELLKKNENEISQVEINQCYALEKRGLNDLEYILGNCNCPVKLRQSAAKEIKLFYETSLDPAKFKSNVEELNKRLNNCK